MDKTGNFDWMNMLTKCLNASENHNQILIVTKIYNNVNGILNITLHTV